MFIIIIIYQFLIVHCTLIDDFITQDGNGKLDYDEFVKMLLSY